jgi:hypothetical protein
MDSKVFERRLKRSAGEGLRHEKGHFVKCLDFVICDPVRSHFELFHGGFGAIGHASDLKTNVFGQFSILGKAGSIV